MKDYQLIRALDLVKALYLFGQNDNLSIQAASEKAVQTNAKSTKPAAKNKGKK